MEDILRAVSWSFSFIYLFFSSLAWIYYYFYL